MRRRSTAAEQDAAHARELFRSRLDGQIDLHHPLRMPWQEDVRMEPVSTGDCR